MCDQATGDNVRILVMDEITLAANISRVTIALRHFMTYVVRSTLCAKMYYHGCMLSFIVFSYLAELFKTLQVEPAC